MYCIPACKGCREAGICPKGEVPASPVSKPRAPYWPDSLAYKRLECGHRADIIPIVLGGKRGPAVAVKCPRGCGWQPMPEHNPIDDVLPDDPGTLF